MNYFDKLPTISYDGYTVKNLLARARLSEQTKSNRTIFYPYTIQNQLRADQISDKYYDDPGYSWLVWFSNDVIDPYYDYPLTDIDFENYIVSKYGSVEAAQRKIAYYRINWVGDGTILTPQQFTSLPGASKKYYDPILSADLELTGYRRKRDDDRVATNQVLSLTITANSSFTVGEEVQVNGSNYGFCTHSNSSVVNVQHIVGTIAANDTIIGVESNTAATVVSVTVLSSTIAAQDTQFWTPVSIYDNEAELNEQKKDIQLVDARYAGSINEELKRLMDT